MTVTITDLGITHANLVVDYGDDTKATTNSSLVPGSYTTVLKHTYATPMTYTVQATLRNQLSGGAIARDASEVEVSSPPPDPRYFLYVPLVQRGWR